MKQLSNKPYFLFLLVLFFILHGTVENYGFIYAKEVLNIGLVILVSVTLFFFFIKLFTKDVLRAALISFFISLIILFFGAIFDAVKRIGLLHWIHSYTIFIPLMLVSFLLFILLIRRKVDLQHRLCFYFNLLLIIYCLYDLSGLVYKSIRSTAPPAKASVDFDPSLVSKKPNVYFLLYDEYPGYKSLQDSFSFPNDSLYHFLNKREFVFLPVFANYNMTFYSMSSMLNMHYIDKPYWALANTVEDDQQRIKEIKQARAIQLFAAMGYTFTNYSIFDILDQPSLKGNSFVISQATLLTHKIFFNRILKDLGWHFISGKYRIPFIADMYMQEDRNNKLIDKKINEMSKQRSLAPRFFYAHYNMPHPPMYCDSLGNYLPVEKIFAQKSYINKQLFLSYLKFANKKIEGITDEICANDPGAIVIIMSDHGYRAYNSTKTVEPYQFDNICAIRFPDKNYVKVNDKLSNVNFFRYLFNCEFNQRMPYLADSSIFLKDKKTEE